ncbi:uncharacterized protein LOC106716651 [Papilio machaon]|uniref:uncharacterized protein LOC106716651 n=1 Tax=Papilio machaon TaxID=76193 RepID=UPI001E664AE9|nr:uncharacterized protein LOC106716651 [Papilio machaon]
MSSNQYWKCYFKCEVTDVLHRFPNHQYNPERFNSWISVLDPNMQKRNPQYIYNNLRLCNRHFELCYHTPSKRLTRNAVPTLNIDLYNMEQEVPPLPKSIPEDMSMEVSQNIKDPKLSGSITTSKPVVPQDKTTRQMQRNICNLKYRLKKLSQKYTTQTKKIKCARNLSLSQAFLKQIEKFPEPIKIFSKLQLKAKYKPRGRRYTMEEKILALTMYKQSAKAYNLLNKMFVLPSKRSLQKLLSHIPLEPGINEHIFAHLKKAVRRLPLEKRLCTLIFDEVALDVGLHFNNGRIIGFEDLGFKSSKLIADHALVFMVKSIKGKFKQPVCFTFTKSCTKKDDLKHLIKLLIRKIHDSGLKVVATVCDQSQTNVGAIKSLKDDTMKKYLRQAVEYKSHGFEVDEHKIFPLYDTPHLLKGVRNNLLRKNARFSDIQEKVAKWDHIKMLFEKDVGEHEIRFVNKLTEYHVFENKIPKMKVKYAAQVFSQRVSSALGFLARHNILPAECQDTAKFLLLFDKLFDSFNGHTYSGTSKELLGCLKNNSPHQQFWAEVLPILKSIKFENKFVKKDGTCTVKFEKLV